MDYKYISIDCLTLAPVYSSVRTKPRLVVHLTSHLIHYIMSDLPHLTFRLQYVCESHSIPSFLMGFL